jgi:hypothetical protein
MPAPEIVHQRLSQQRLSRNPFHTPEEVVTWLGAVQAQDYSGAKWALGLRMEAVTDGSIEQAFTDGRILRTHVMRPTWHFVTPADIRWLLELTAPRVRSANAYMERRLELDEGLFRRSNDLIANALQGGQRLTRKEIGSLLAEAGITAQGPRLSHIMIRAELSGIVCSGPRRGKQFTYTLLDERAPNARRLPRDEALAELTRLYYTGHGLATIKDFAWWSGLTMADARAGIEMLATSLTSMEIDGQAYYCSESLPPAAVPKEMAFLLPTYDEFFIGFSSFDKSRMGGRNRRQKAVFDARIVIDGRVVGSWRRTFQKDVVVIEIAPFAPLTAGERIAITSAAQRYGDFVGMTVRCESS